MKIQTSSRPDSGKLVCPYCRESLGQGEIQSCGGCHTDLHDACFWENGGCTSFGCSAPPTKKDRPDRNPDRLRCQQCQEVLSTANSTFCVRCGFDPGHQAEDADEDPFIAMSRQAARKRTRRNAVRPQSPWIFRLCLICLTLPIFFVACAVVSDRLGLNLPSWLPWAGFLAMTFGLVALFTRKRRKDHH